jgi:hypothetical protein
MRVLCIGDVAISENISPSWLPPGDITPGDEMRILFNWELPLGKTINPTPRTSGPRLLSHPNSVNTIRKWAPAYAALATNHIVDAGEEGLSGTIAALHQAGFQTVGAGLSVDEIKKPLLWETSEGRLAVINWVFPETHPDWEVVPGPNCWPGLEGARVTIRSLKDQADWVLIIVHWSDELFPYPRLEDRLIAHQLIDMGASVVIGHHPHVVRGIEIIGSSPVFYSLGNFYFSNISDGQGRWVNHEAPRNREGLGIQFYFHRGEQPEYDILSFWHTGERVVLDPLHRAARRMKWASQPLSGAQNSTYAKWYANQRASFDRLGYRLHFGLWKLNKGSVKRNLLKAYYRLSGMMKHQA